MATTLDVMGAVLRSLKAGRGFRWDAAVGRYRDRSTGRFVSESALSELAESFRDYTADNIAAINERLINGGSLDAWREAFAREMKDSRLTNMMIGRGGRNAATQSDYGRVGARLRQDYNSIDGLYAKWQNGEISGAQLQAQSKAFVNQTWRSYDDGRISAMEAAEAMMLFSLGNTERHCSTCLDMDGTIASAREWRAGVTDAGRRLYRPRQRELECGGYKCDCTLTPVGGEE